MKKKQIEDDGFTSTTSTSTRITPLEIQQKEFPVSRLSGYKMRDVDEFLDQVTGAMSLLEEENKRLRAGVGGGPLLGTPDIEDVSRQADEIIQRARDEAAQILRDAESRSAALGAAAAPGPVGDEARVAVTAFLGREREFLQSLASLVQQHAETVKGMAKSARDRNTAPSQAAARVPSPPASEPAPAPPMTQPMPAQGPPEAASPEDRPQEASNASAPDDEPIRVDEPATASVGSSDDEEQSDQGGDRSLRELFWGEE
jgi:DivIVA domain-containing protein